MTYHTLSYWNHGFAALIAWYVLSLIATIAGLIQGRASLSRYLCAPMTAILTALLGMLGAMGLNLWIGAGQETADLVAKVVFNLLDLIAIGYFLGWLSSQKGNPLSHIRGALVVPERARSSTAIGPREGLDFARYPLPPSDETKHFKLIGTTGTGKSTVIQDLVSQALARGDRAVVADPDGSYVDRFYSAARGDVILNPFDARSCKWDVYREIRNTYDVEQLARSLIPDADMPGTTEWREYARTFFAAVLRQSLLLGNRDGSELYRLLAHAPNEELEIYVEDTAAQPFLMTGNARMFGSIRTVTATAVAALAFLSEQKGTLLSVRDWVTRGKGALFLPYKADQIAALKNLIATWMRLAIFQTMSERAKDNRLWFIVDELDALGRIDGLKDALARLRKFGGRCVLGMQSIAQVSGTYGKAEGQTIVENCGNTLILRCSASEGGGTAEFASKLIGQREVMRKQESRSRGGRGFFASDHRSVNTTMQQITEYAVLPSEIEQLPDFMGYLKIASSREWWVVKFG